MSFGPEEPHAGASEFEEMDLVRARLAVWCTGCSKAVMNENVIVRDGKCYCPKCAPK